MRLDLTVGIIGCTGGLSAGGIILRFDHRYPDLKVSLRAGSMILIKGPVYLRERAAVAGPAPHLSNETRPTCVVSTGSDSLSKHSTPPTQSIMNHQVPAWRAWF